MSEQTQCIARWTAAASMSVLLAAGCASMQSDGGIVGTGNRIDCEAEARKSGTPDSVPEECKRENRK